MLESRIRIHEELHVAGHMDKDSYNYLIRYGIHLRTSNFTTNPASSSLFISLSVVFPWKNKFRCLLNHGSEPLSWTLDKNPLWSRCGEEDFTAFGTATRVNIRWIRMVCARMHHSPQPMHSRRQPYQLQTISTSPTMGCR